MTQTGNSVEYDIHDKNISVEFALTNGIMTFERMLNPPMPYAKPTDAEKEMLLLQIQKYQQCEKIIKSNAPQIPAPPPGYSISKGGRRRRRSRRRR